MAGLNCPNKSEKRWKKVEKVMGETETHRLYLSYGDEVPQSFELDQLSETDVRTMANYYNRKSNTAENNYLRDRLPRIINGIPRDKMGKIVGPFEANAVELEDQMRNSLVKFLTGLGIRVDLQADDIIDFDHDGTPRKWGEKGAPFAAYDKIQKFLALREDISNPEFARAAARILYFYLGKKSKLVKDLKANVHKWSGYMDLYNEYKRPTEEGEDERLDSLARDKAITVLFEKMILLGAEYGFEEDTIKKVFRNPDINKDFFDEKGFHDTRYEKNWWRRMWNHVLNFWNTYVKGKRRFDNYSERDLLHMVMEIVDDVYKQDFTKFYRSYSQLKDKTFEDAKGNPMEVKEFEKTFDKDPYAKSIVDNFIKLLSPEQDAYKFSGSQVLRAYGRLIRALSEDLHDIDGIIHLDHMRKEQHYDTLLNWLDTKALDIAMDVVKYKFDPVTQKTNIKVVKRGNQKKFKQELEKHLEQLSWYKNLKNIYPSWTFENAFISKDQVVEGLPNTVTVMGYVEHPTETEVNEKTGKRQPKRYQLDFFMRMREGRFPERFDGDWFAWKGIFEAKLDMGRAKDLNDSMFFLPFKEDRRTFKFKNKGYNMMTFSQDLEVSDSMPVQELIRLNEAVQETRKVMRIQPTEEEMEEREVSQQKLAKLNESLGIKVIEDNTIDAFAQVDPYKEGELPVMRVNFSRGGMKQDTIIHEFGHIFIDSLGGMSDPMVEMGRKHLVGSDVEMEVMHDPAYQGLSKEVKDKEVLARAIGKEGARIYSAETGNLMERFANWARLFFNKIKKAFGFDYNVAMEMARRLLRNEVVISKEMFAGSEVAQKQAFPESMTDVQESTLSSITLLDNGMSMTADEKFYETPMVEGSKLTRTSNRMETVYPQTAFPESRKKYYAHSRAWGNISDILWNETVNGKNFGEIMEVIEDFRKSDPKEVGPYNIQEDQMKLMYEYAKNFVTTMQREGNVVVAQKSIYSAETLVGGTTDIIVIRPNGHLLIFDNKSSHNPTRKGSLYGPEDQWSYADRGELESYKDKHTKQLSAYQKMYEDLGFRVDGLYVIPTRWEEIEENTVTKVDLEPTIPIRYNAVWANQIIDNKQRKGRELFAENEKLEEIINNLNAKISERVQVVMARYKADKSNQSWYVEMEALGLQLAANSSLGNILEFVRQGQKRTKYVLDQLKIMERRGISNYTDDALLIYKMYANTFDLIADIEKQVDYVIANFLPPYNDAFETHIKNKTKPTDADELEDFIDYKRMKFTHRYASILRESQPNGRPNMLTELSNNITKVNNTYYALAHQKTAKELARVSKWGEAKFYNDTLKEWKANNPRSSFPGMSRDAWEQEGRQYTREQIAANKSQIANMNYEHFLQLLREAPKDIDSLSMWLVDQKNLDDGVIQVAERVLARAEFDANQAFIQEVRSAEAIYKDFIAAQQGVSESDYEKLYEDLITKRTFADGTEQYYLVGKYNPEFKAEEQAWHTKNRREGYTPTYKERNEFYKNLRAKHSGDNNPKYKKLMAMDESNPIRKMYDTLVDRFQRVDDMLPSHYGLGLAYSDGYDAETKTTFNVVQYKLPSVMKSSLDRINRMRRGQDSLVESAKAEWSEAFIRNSQYTESGQQEADEEGNVSTKKFKVRESIKKIYIDENNNAARFVPVHYRNRIEQGQQSLDLMSISMIDFHMASNYSAKQEIVPTMEMLKDVLQERETVQTDPSGKTLVNRVAAGLNFTKKNKDKASNAFRAFHSIVEDRLYGIGTVELGEFTAFGRQWNTNKVAERVMGWTGDTMLILNDLAAVTGLVQGNVMNWMEAVAGTDLSKKSIAKAEVMYFAPRTFSGTIRDAMGSRRPTGLVNLLAEKFNARSDFKGLHARYGQNRTGNLAHKGTLHMLQNTQEHFVQSTLMMGILLDEKLQKKDGTIVTDDKGAEVSLMDAYYVTEDGFLEVHDKYKQYITQDLEFEMSSRIREVTKQAHGNYDSNNRAMLQRYVLGKMTFMLRKWLVSGVQKRYRGMFAVDGPWKGEMRELGSVENKFFSESLGRFEEGTYTTAARFIRTLLQDMKILKLKMVSNELDKMSPEERANVKRTIYEVSMMIASITAAQVLAGLAKASLDDDEKKRLWYRALIARRLFAELSFYSNPWEFYNVMRSPMATISMAERAGRLISQLVEDLFNLEFEKYQKGRRKGTVKAKKYLHDVVPVMSQLDRESQEIYKMMEF